MVGIGLVPGTMVQVSYDTKGRKEWGGNRYWEKGSRATTGESSSRARKAVATPAPSRLCTLTSISLQIQGTAERKNPGIEKLELFLTIPIFTCSS